MGYIGQNMENRYVKQSITFVGIMFPNISRNSGIIYE